MRGPELLRHVQDPWFVTCLIATIDTPELVVEFDRLYGANLTRRGTGLDLMIDDATGRTGDDLDRFTDFVRDCVYSRVQRPE